MAKRKCAECGAVVGSAVAVCPECQYPLGEAAEQTAPRRRAERVQRAPDEPAQQPLEVRPPIAKTHARFQWIPRLLTTLELLAILAFLSGACLILYFLYYAFTDPKQGGYGGIAVVYVLVTGLGTAIQIVMYRGAAEALRALVEIHAKTVFD